MVLAPDGMAVAGALDALAASPTLMDLDSLMANVAARRPTQLGSRSAGLRCGEGW